MPSRAFAALLEQASSAIAAFQTIWAPPKHHA
jgi:hypothetical protein